jgi:hypothetical protein
MNRRGVVLGFIPAMFGGIAFCMMVAAVVLRPSHIDRRAIQKCEYFGNTDCEVTVQSMNQEQKIEYIRDTVDSPSSVWLQ